MYIKEKAKANAFNYGREGNKIEKIVIHHWGKDGQKFDNVVNFFSSVNCETSAHIVLEGGRVCQMVDFKDTAFHAGRYTDNLKSIGIECKPEMSTQDIETLCEFIGKEIYPIFGILPIVGHCDIVPTRCPYRYYNQIPTIFKKAKEYLGDEKMKKLKIKVDNKIVEVEAIEKNNTNYIKLRDLPKICGGKIGLDGKTPTYSK